MSVCHFKNKCEAETKIVAIFVQLEEENTSQNDLAKEINVIVKPLNEIYRDLKRLCSIETSRIR